MGDVRWHLTTLAYARCGDHLALLRRRKEPNLGLWSPPGGKIEPGESPLGAALRELREETGLEGSAPRLSAVVSELDVERGDAWLMFVVRLTVPRMPKLAAHREGEPRWVAIRDVARLPRPPADDRILEAVLDDRPGVAFLEVRFRHGHLIGIEASRSTE
jgi:8-oxo-dGTP diphosphatase